MTATQAFLQTEGISDRVHPISVEAYHALGDLGRVDRSVELLRGVVVEKMSKSPLHSAIVRRLFQYFFPLIERNPDFALLKEDPLTLKDSEPEPDLAIVDAREAEDFHHHPTTAHLVVEVAVTPIEVDRQKAPIYAEAGIPEFWLVRPSDGEIEVYSRPENGVYREMTTLSGSDSLGSATFPDISLSVEELLRVPSSN